MNPQNFNLPLTFRCVRTIKGKTQKQLAKEANVAQSHISRIESNKKAPSLEILSRLLSILNIRLSQFFNVAEAMAANNLKKKDLDFIEQLLNLREKEVDLLSKLIQINTTD